MSVGIVGVPCSGRACVQIPGAVLGKFAALDANHGERCVKRVGHDRALTRHPQGEHSTPVGQKGAGDFLIGRIRSGLCKTPFPDHLFLQK